MINLPHIKFFFFQPLDMIVHNVGYSRNALCVLNQTSMFFWNTNNNLTCILKVKNIKLHKYCVQCCMLHELILSTTITWLPLPFPNTTLIVSTFKMLYKFLVARWFLIFCFDSIHMNGVIFWKKRQMMYQINWWHNFPWDSEGPSWSWSYGSWIYDCLLPLKLWVRKVYLRQVGGFLWVFRLPPPIKLTAKI